MIADSLGVGSSEHTVTMRLETSYLMKPFRKIFGPSVVLMTRHAMWADRKKHTFY
jgi:hypothetical protein